METNMFKKLALASALAGLFIGPAAAAPTGWYQLDLGWRDGAFTGQMYYDSASPFLALQVRGTLADLAQTTLMSDVWNVSHDAPADPWVAFTNAQGASPDDYDAAFYLHLLDLGDTLAIDTAQDNSLYDWSQDYAWYVPGQLDQSPLTSWSIAPLAAAVPEPGSIGLLLAGMAAAASAGRRGRRPG
jgi:hypothetical protein